MVARNKKSAGKGAGLDSVSGLVSTLPTIPGHGETTKAQEPGLGSRMWDIEATPPPFPDCFKSVVHEKDALDRKAKNNPLHPTQPSKRYDVLESVRQGLMQMNSASSNCSSSTYLAALVVALQHATRHLEMTLRERALEFAKQGTTASLTGSKEKQQKQRNDLKMDHALSVAQEDISTMCALLELIGMSLSDASVVVINKRGLDIIAIFEHALKCSQFEEMTWVLVVTNITLVLPMLDSTNLASPKAQRAFWLLCRSSCNTLHESVRDRAHSALLILYTKASRAQTLVSKTSASSAEFIERMLGVAPSTENEDFVIDQRTLELFFDNTLPVLLAYGLKPKDGRRVVLLLKDLLLKQTQQSTVAALSCLSSVLERADDAEVATDKSNIVSNTELKLESASIIAEIGIPSLKAGVLAIHAYAETVSHFGAFLLSLLVSSKKYSPQVATIFPKLVARLVECCSPRNIQDDIAPIVNRLTAMVESLCSKLPHSEKLLADSFAPLKALVCDDVYLSMLPSLVGPVQTFLDGVRVSNRSQVLDVMLQECIVKMLGMRDHDRRLYHIANKLISSVAKNHVDLLLKHVSFKYDNSNGILSNAWLLPLIRDNVSSAKIEVFGAIMYPVQQTLSNVVQACEARGALIQAKNARILCSQVWSSLPGFLHDASDLFVLLDRVCRLVDELFQHEQGDFEMARVGCKAVKNIANAYDHLDCTEDKRKQQDSYLKNCKPLLVALLKIIEHVQADHRPEMSETIRILAASTKSQAFVSQWLRIAIKRLLQSSSETEKEMSANRQVAADVAVALASSQVLEPSSSELGLLRRALEPYLTDPSDAAMQKITYRAFSTMLDQETMEASTDLVMALSSHRDSLTLTAKAGRLLCLQVCVRKIAEEDIDKLWAECQVELCISLRDVSLKTREAGFAAILEFAQRYRKKYAEPIQPEKGLVVFIQTLSAGLAMPSPLVIASTLTALARLIFEYRTEVNISKDLLQTLAFFYCGNDATKEQRPTAAATRSHDSAMDDNDDTAVRRSVGIVPILLRHESHEVVGAALGMVKLACAILKKDDLIFILPYVLPSLLAISTDSRNEDRLKVKIILERCLKKVGRTGLESVFPEDHRKLLTSVRRSHERAMKKKANAKLDTANRDDTAVVSSTKHAKTGFEAAFEVSDDESIFSASDDEQQERRGSTKSSVAERLSSAFNLLDSETSVLAAAGKDSKRKLRDVEAPVRQGKTRDPESVFEISHDGRPIIRDLDDDLQKHERGHGRGDGLEKDDGEEAELTNLQNIFEENAEIMNRKKRKYASANDDEDLPDDEQAVASGKKTGESLRRPKKGFPQLAMNLGQVYKSKKAPGDVKRAGMPDPYAYLPLGRSLFRSVKGKKVQYSVGGIHKLMQAGKKGAARGIKSRKMIAKSRTR